MIMNESKWLILGVPGEEPNQCQHQDDDADIEAVRIVHLPYQEKDGGKELFIFYYLIICQYKPDMV